MTHDNAILITRMNLFGSILGSKYRFIRSENLNTSSKMVFKAMKATIVLMINEGRVIMTCHGSVPPKVMIRASQFDPNRENFFFSLIKPASPQLKTT